MARPMPRAAPVTTATFPFSDGCSNVTRSDLHGTHLADASCTWPLLAKSRGFIKSSSPPVMSVTLPPASSMRTRRRPRPTARWTSPNTPRTRRPQHVHHVDGRGAQHPYAASLGAEGPHVVQVVGRPGDRSFGKPGDQQRVFSVLSVDDTCSGTPFHARALAFHRGIRFIQHR